MFFDNPYETTEEGPVKIEFEEIKFEERKRNRVKVTFTIDFSKTDLSAEKAAIVFQNIIAVLRLGLEVNLSKYQ